jgi:2-methylcitrate dehydratase
VTPDLFDEAIIMEERVRMSLPKIKVAANMEFEAAFPALQRCHVAVDTNSGESYEKQVDYPIGDPRNPMSDEQMHAKFDALCGDEVSSERRAAIRDAIDRMESVEPAELIKLFTFDA